MPTFYALCGYARTGQLVFELSLPQSEGHNAQKEHRQAIPLLAQQLGLKLNPETTYCIRSYHKE